jgi:hypothetical protein
MANVVGRFYVITGEDLRRCNESRLSRRPITLARMSETHEMKTFTGVVQAVAYIRNPPSMSWRITISDH